MKAGFSAASTYPFCASIRDDLASAGNHQIWRKCLLQLFRFPKEKRPLSSYLVYECLFRCLHFLFKQLLNPVSAFQLNLKVSHKFQDTKLSQV